MDMKKKKGFTLVELLVVIAVIGILFVTLISKVDFATDKARATGIQTDFRGFQMGIEMLLREKPGFDAAGITDTATCKTVLNNNLDAKLKFVDADGSNPATPADPWGVPYVISFTAATESVPAYVTITSYGADKAAGTAPTITWDTANGICSITPAAGSDDYVLAAAYLPGHGVVMKNTFEK